MKKIINGIRYNTDTATKASSYRNGCSKQDFKWYEETLYCSPNGRWFLVGSGGPMSKYAQWCESGGYDSGFNIFHPLTNDSAFEWLQRHDQELAERFFSEKIQDA